MKVMKSCVYGKLFDCYEKLNIVKINAYRDGKIKELAWREKWNRIGKKREYNYERLRVLEKAAAYGINSMIPACGIYIQ